MGRYSCEGKLQGGQSPGRRGWLRILLLTLYSLPPSCRAWSPDHAELVPYHTLQIHNALSEICMGRRPRRPGRAYIFIRHSQAIMPHIGLCHNFFMAYVVRPRNGLDRSLQSSLSCAIFIPHTSHRRGAHCAPAAVRRITRRNIRQGPSFGTMQASSPTNHFSVCGKKFTFLGGRTMCAPTAYFQLSCIQKTRTASGLPNAVRVLLTPNS